MRLLDPLANLANLTGDLIRPVRMKLRLPAQIQDAVRMLGGVAGSVRFDADRDQRIGRVERRKPAFARARVDIAQLFQRSPFGESLETGLGGAGGTIVEQGKVHLKVVP